MAKLSFDIKNSGDLLKKLQDDHNDFLQDPTSSRIALNCAMTAWHLVDWVFNEYKLSGLVSKNAKRDALRQFQEELKAQCSELQIMNDIADGTKHCEIDRKHDTQSTNLHEGSFSNDFSRDFDISCLLIQMDNGSEVYFEDSIESVMSFWENYINSLKTPAIN